VSLSAFQAFSLKDILMLKKILLSTSVIAGLSLAVPANAAPVIVDALGNSSSGGTGAASGLSLTTGQLFNITSSLTDLWSAGALPRWSNANGLTGNTFATGSDESGEALGTQIGSNFGLWSQNGISAPFGSLVGEIGGVYQLLGANFSGAAWGTGNLNLFYWDSNNGDNTGRITFDATLAQSAVPEPASWALMILGFGLAGAALRSRKPRVTVSFG
jgi:PEP-CTERM motif